MFLHSQGSACMYFRLIERMLGIVDCNDSHFRSCYIEYNQGHNK